MGRGGSHLLEQRPLAQGVVADGCDHVRVALLDAALTENQGWTKALGTPPKDAKTAATWRRLARTVAAYRDRYGITDIIPLGAPGEDDAQKIDAARARAALDRARDLARGPGEEPQRRAGREPVRRSL